MLLYNYERFAFNIFRFSDLFPFRMPDSKNIVRCLLPSVRVNMKDTNRMFFIFFLCMGLMHQVFIKHLLSEDRTRQKTASHKKDLDHYHHIHVLVVVIQYEHCFFLLRFLTMCRIQELNIFLPLRHACTKT